ncbi:hypothetical protein [Blastochloris tepida]|nr:hypothetical protein [Blastochloris tepida]
MPSGHGAGRGPARAPAGGLPGAGAARRPGELETTRPHLKAPGKGGAKREHPHQRPAPEKILQAFNTWSFKREQPDNKQAILNVIGDLVHHDQPIQFLMYWGKGPRHSLAKPDTACLDHLKDLTRRVDEVYRHGATFRLIFTDTHAELNGHGRDVCERYFQAVAAAAAARGFDACRLSHLMAAVGMVECDGDIDEAVPEDTLEKLRVCAEKWYRGEGGATDGAEKYYRMNMREKRVVELAFPRAIFTTFNGSQFRSLFPDRLPVFYMYSLRRGVSIKPWFIPEAADGTDPHHADAHHADASHPQAGSTDAPWADAPPAGPAA